MRGIDRRKQCCRIARQTSGNSPSKDLLDAVVTQLRTGLYTVLVLDNIETVWLAGGTSVAAVDELLGRLA